MVSILLAGPEPISGPPRGPEPLPPRLAAPIRHPLHVPGHHLGPRPQVPGRLEVAVLLGSLGLHQLAAAPFGDPRFLFQDPEILSSFYYSLSKILEREDYRSLPGWDKFYKEYMTCIDHVIIALKKKDDAQARKCLTQIRKEIGKISGRLKENIAEVFRRASINKASRIYEHGISMERTAKLLGITMYELADYAGGNKGITDVPESKTVGEKERIKLVMEMFR